MKKRLLGIVMFFFLIIGTTGAFEIPSMQVGGGLLWMGNGLEEGGPSPLLRSLHTSVQMSVTRLFFLEPEIRLFGTQYQLAADEAKVIPTEIEFANSVWFLSLVLDLQAGFNFALSRSFALGFTVFPSLVFRMPVRSWGTCAEEDSECKSTMTSYFYQKARFLYPALGGYAAWRMFEKIGLVIRIKGYIPLFHLWDGEVLADGSRVPFYDQLVVSLGLGIRWYFK